MFWVQSDNSKERCDTPRKNRNQSTNLRRLNNHITGFTVTEKGTRRPREKPGKTLLDTSASFRVIQPTAGRTLTNRLRWNSPDADSPRPSRLWSLDLAPCESTGNCLVGRPQNLYRLAPWPTYRADHERYQTSISPNKGKALSSQLFLGLLWIIETDSRRSTFFDMLFTQPNLEDRRKRRTF